MALRTHDIFPFTQKTNKQTNKHSFLLNTYQCYRSVLTTYFPLHKKQTNRLHDKLAPQCSSCCLIPSQNVTSFLTHDGHLYKDLHKITHDSSQCFLVPFCCFKKKKKKLKFFEGRKEGNVLFNDALNTFYLRLYGVRHMVKDHSDSEK